MSDRRNASGFSTLAIGVILLIGLAGGVLYFYRVPVVVDDAEATQIFNYYTIHDIPDETDVNEAATTEILDDQGKITVTDLDDIDRDGDGTTDGSDPDADGNNVLDEEEYTVEDPLPPPDYAFSGVVNAKAELLDSSGQPLSILPQDFVKTRGGGEIDSMKLSLDWDFVLGEDLDEDSVSVHIIGTLTSYYQNAAEQYVTGDLRAGKILDLYSPSNPGYATYTWKTDDPVLHFKDAKNYGDLVYITTTGDSFKLTWEATVSTKGGIVKVIKGEFGILLTFMWDEWSAEVFSSPYDQLWQQMYPDDPYYWTGESIVQMTIP